MKQILNEPENLTKRREKQVHDDLKTEIELLRLQKENNDEKYDKMKEEINKIANGSEEMYN